VSLVNKQAYRHAVILCVVYPMLLVPTTITLIKRCSQSQ